jgi:tripartite ATP-independent transporter DctM subunit
VEIWIYGIILFGSLILLLGIGIPVSISTGLVSIVGSLYFLGSKGMFIYAKTAFAGPASFVMLAVPFFVFMANILEYSGLADDLYEAFYKWMGYIKGGLAMGTVIICAIFAAMAGISSVATVTMGLIALPSMLKRKYNKEIALGCIAGGGALGILIPPSLVFILYGAQTDVSIGKLFMGGIIPGILLALLFIVYIAIRCYLQPHLGPPIGEKFRFAEKLRGSKAVILPMFLVIAVLGSIYSGIATPTEAAAAGALGSLICCAINKKLNRQNFVQATLRTIALSGMIMWIVIGAEAFTHILAYSRVQMKVIEWVTQLEVSPWTIMIGIQIFYVILGMILDPAGIILLTIPLVFPIISGLGFDPLWFGVIFCINMEMSYLTPPFGFNLFILKTIVPEGISLADIYRSIVPFVMLQALCLIIVMIFPSLAVWLPNMMIGN